MSTISSGQRWSADYDDKIHLLDFLHYETAMASSYFSFSAYDMGWIERPLQRWTLHLPAETVYIEVKMCFC